MLHVARGKAATGPHLKRARESGRQAGSQAEQRHTGHVAIRVRVKYFLGTQEQQELQPSGNCLFFGAWQSGMQMTQLSSAPANDVPQNAAHGTERHKATHGRKGHSLKTVIKCDRQRALQPRFADTFLGAWPSPVQLQLSSQFPVQSQPQLTVQSSPAQLSLFLFQHPHLSQKSCKSPAALHVFHAALVTRTRTHSLPSFSSSSSLFAQGHAYERRRRRHHHRHGRRPLRPVASLGRPVRISHIGFHVCHFCDVAVVPAPATFYADYTSNPQRVPCLASPRLALPRAAPCAACQVRGGDSASPSPAPHSIAICAIGI